MPMNDCSSDDRVAIVDLADDLQVRKQRIFKILPRLGIRSTQRREPARGNQNVATVSHAEAIAIRSEIERSSDVITADPLSREAGITFSEDTGFFYLIQLEPAHDPGRFKVGFTTDLDGRIRKHRCSAPFSKYIRTWPCKRVWERAAVDCATKECEQLHTEVFRSGSLETVATCADSFFSLMPSLATEAEDDQNAETATEAG